MVTSIILIILGLIVIAALFIFAVEIKRAVWVDCDEPFLYDDYDPKKDPMLKMRP